MGIENLSFCPAIILSFIPIALLAIPIIRKRFSRQKIDSRGVGGPMPWKLTRHTKQL